MHKSTDVAIAHVRLAESVPPTELFAWEAVVLRDRSVVVALADGDKGMQRVLLERLTKLHNQMWATLSSVRQ